jgi:hypothetical protein
MIPRISDGRLGQVSAKVLKLVPPDMAAEFRLLPIEVDNEGTITLAMADPTNNHAVDEVAFFADRFVVRAVATESAVRRAIEAHYGVRFTSPRASDRVTAPPTVASRVKPTAATAASGPSSATVSPAKATPAPRSTAGSPSAAPPSPTPKAKPAEPPKPTKEELDQQIVLLTKIKRSEETPLPIPVPPPEDYRPEYAQDEPIPLTKPKQPRERERRDTLPGMTIPVPDPPLAQLRAAHERDEIAREMLDYVGFMTRRAIFFVIKKQLLVPHDSRGDLDRGFVKQLAINIEAPSIFRDVVASRLPYRGPLPETAANRAFSQMIGGAGSEVLLMPVSVRERIIAVLFADTPILPLPDSALYAATREAGLAYERLILEAKGR